MPRLRAVAMIQPAGLGGTPSTGHRTRATTNAAWTASTARSKSPRKRTSVATALPELSRNAAATSSWVVVPAVGTGVPASALVGGGVVLERADLDGALA